MNSSKSICKRRMREYAGLFDATIPPDDFLIRNCGTWVNGKMSRDDMMTLVLRQIGDVTLVAARYAYYIPSADSTDPFNARSFSAIKVYYKEN